MYTKVNVREFNRLYGNLNELHRRVFDKENGYPQTLCAKWFVRELMGIINKEDFSQRLNQEQIDLILDKSVSLLRAKILDSEYKQALVFEVKELRKLKSSFQTNEIVGI